MRPMLTGSILLALSFTPALAIEPVEFTPKPTANHPKATVDVIGLVTGMTPAEAQAALKETDSRYKVNSEEQWIGGDFNGARIKTSLYVASMRAEINSQEAKSHGESVTLKFSSPASSNQLVHINRWMGFYEPLQSPNFNEFIKTLKGKYGEPSAIEANRGRINEQGEPWLVELIWSFQDGKVISCNKNVLADATSPCSTSAPSWTIDRSVVQLQAKYEQKMVFRLERHKEDGKRLGSLMMELADVARYKVNAKADFDALINFSKEVGPVKATAPKI